MPSEPGDLRARWWNSFYWRLGVSFVVFVVAVVMAQSVIFTSRIAQTSRDDAARSPNNIAIGIAAELEPAIESGEAQDLGAFLREHFGGERAAYVVMKDGRVAGASDEELSPEIRRAAELILAGARSRRGTEQPRVPGPVVIAPLQVNGALQGLVVLPPPPPRGVIRDAARFLSLPGTALLFVATIIAAFVIFAPARRRLVALENAAARMGSGDLSARAPEAGRDEIARVARAFNRMGDEIAARDESLRTADRLRRQMFADVSHELRTPLTAMRGYIETLQMPELAGDEERRARYFETVRRETRRLDRIVTDLLDLARYENGVGAFDVRVFAIQRVFEHVVRRHERDIESRGIAIRMQVEDAADQILADPDRIEQVIENLVANALRHLPAGGTLELRATQVPGAVSLSVTDSGSGIAAEHLAHIFDRFYKTDASRAAGAMGSGLGLSIVKAIVEQHGGTVTVGSRPGRTAFTIRLPQTGRPGARDATSGVAAAEGSEGVHQSASANL